MTLEFNMNTTVDYDSSRYQYDPDVFNGTFNLTSYETTTTPATMGSKSVGEKVVGGLLLMIIIICSVVGNSLVCIAVMTQRSLRRSSNFFYVSLACSDLLVSLAVMTFAGINDVKERWVFGPIFCNIWMSLDVMCCTASILNICAISFDRYLHIWKPYTYKHIMSPWRTILLIVCVWLLSGLISFLPIHLKWHIPDDYISDENTCLISFNRYYAVSSSVISFYIPCIIMLFMYISMYRLAQHHIKSIKKQTMSYSAAATEHAYKPSDHKASITLGVIMGVFLICWMPFFTVNVLTAFVTLPQYIFTVVTWLGYINSMANPIIYTIFNKEFRMAFKKLLFIERCCGKCKQSNCRKTKQIIKQNGQSKNATNGNSHNARYGALPKETASNSTACVTLTNLHNNNTENA